MKPKARTQSVLGLQLHICKFWTPHFLLRDARIAKRGVAIVGRPFVRPTVRITLKVFHK